MTALVIPFVRAPNVADARAELVKWSHAVIRSMHRQCDEDVLTDVVYLRQFGGEADKLLADQVQRECACATKPPPASRFATCRAGPRFWRGRGVHRLLVGRPSCFDGVGG